MDVLVPDIGDFKDVPVIEILVKPGDEIAAEAPLVTLESDKATMDVPSPSAGVVREIAVKVGDKVSQGTLVVRLEAKDKESRSAATEREPAAPEQPVAASRGGVEPVEQQEPEKSFRETPAKSAGGKAPPVEIEEPDWSFEEQPPPTPRKEYGGPTARVPPPRGDIAFVHPGCDREASQRVHARPGVRQLARELAGDL